MYSFILGLSKIYTKGIMLYTFLDDIFHSELRVQVLCSVGSHTGWL